MGSSRYGRFGSPLLLEDGRTTAAHALPAGLVQSLRRLRPERARRAPIDDPDVEALCRGIVASQQSEIDWMAAKLARAVQ